MSKNLLLLLLIFSFTLPLKTFAQSEDIYSFASAKQQQQFAHLTQEFRCLVCQNETLADSNAPLAQDLRKAIAQMIQQGQTDQQVRDYLVQRYGQFVLFKPLFEAKTYLLWLAPFILLLAGIVGLLFVLQRRSYSQSTLALSPSEQQRLQKLCGNQ